VFEVCSVAIGIAKNILTIIVEDDYLLMAVFWVVARCSLIEVYRRFKGACCLHHQGDDRRQPSSYSPP
jgi:hypothetical protein